MTQRSLALLLALSGLWAGWAGAAAAQVEGRGAVERGGGGTVIYLVRHAETVPDGSRDPALSAAGRERAELLGRMLVGAGLTAIHTTGYERTRETAAAVGRVTGLMPAPYDPSQLSAFAERLVEAGGRHLVVGHSNTTPELVRLLGGDPAGPIRESEYGRVYEVVVPVDGAVSTAIFGYPVGVPEDG